MQIWKSANIIVFNMKVIREFLGLRKQNFQDIVFIWT